eukprot:Nitzschia sp. Nitz4//scaffold197_size40390//28012//29073//NITZ4_007520-RA/size40390-exonerate_est2genome-gene-0.14-mRNA-1//1//CDS//3329540493//4343//frame0
MGKRCESPAASFRFVRCLVLVIVLILVYAATFRSTVKNLVLLPPGEFNDKSMNSTNEGTVFDGSLELVTAETLRIQEQEEGDQLDSNEDTAPRNKKVIWSNTRMDRSGSSIQDMLMCHAYAFANDMTYGGACARDKPMIPVRQRAQEALIQEVGLEKILRFRCPQDESIKITDRRVYYKKDTQIFTPAYIKYLQTLLSYPTKSSAARHIAVHIRRGDITPCRPIKTGYQRYLPNQHYLNLIDRYNPQNDSQVVIYSESDAFESFNEFRARGYEVLLDSDLVEVWRGMLTSDVLILSRSSFSLVPAVMHRGTVVYTPFWHQPLKHWDVVDESLVNQSTAEFYRLRATCPEPEAE